MTKILTGDCLEVLRTMADNSVDAVVTDPPYGWRFMGKAWDGEDIEKTFRRDRAEGDNKLRPAHAAGKYNQSLQGNLAFQEWTKLWAIEALRVLKPGGHALIFCGPRTYHAMAMGVEMAGFEIRDQLQWIFGSGFPKSHNLKGECEGWGTALKPANEPIVLARKPLEGPVAENVLKWGTGALNIDASRIGYTSEADKASARPGSLTVTEKRGGNVAYCSTTTLKKMEQNWEQPQGRWPANVVFDEEAAKMLDEQSIAGGIHSAGKARPRQEHHGDFGVGDHGERIRMADHRFDDKTIGASRFFYCAKASKSERNKGLENEVKHKEGARPSCPDDTGKFPDHDHRPTQGNNHPTVKPIKLMEYLCRLITQPNGTILDPFMGSGSTGVAAKNLGFKFIGIEMNPEYVAIAEKRIKACEPKQLDISNA